MVLDRRTAPAGVLFLLAVVLSAVAGCDGSHSSTAPQQSTPPAVTASSTAQSAAPTSSQPASSPPASTPARPARTTPVPSRPAATSVAVQPPPVTVPAHLCSGMDAAQNAADAYLGALSAGNLAEATACVLPKTVPESLTRSLLAKAGSAVAYLPRDGADGPSVFGYQGSGKLIDVTVGKQSNGQFRVTKVVVRSS
jgi:hypothetical protein